MIKHYSTHLLLVVGFCWLSPCLYGQSLKSLQDVQLLTQQGCVVVQVNADWNISASINISGLQNCYIVEASIDNKDYGAALAKEWNIKSVPTIIVFEYGKELKRFEAGLAFRLDEKSILSKIKQEIDNIMLRRFQ
jgi:hypothetical protein